MSLTELKVVVTESNAAVVADFIVKLHAVEGKSLTEAAKRIEVVDTEEVKAESEAPKKEPAKRASRVKKPEPVEEETEEQEDELEEEQKFDGKADITADDLRELQAKKVGAHRDAIIKKLNGLGAKNITSLDESKFAEYYNFLAELA